MTTSNNDTSRSQQIEQQFRDRRNTPSATATAGVFSRNVSPGSTASRVVETGGSSTRSTHQNADNSHREPSSGCHVFSKAEILRATNNWDRQIASGGFGTVFVGKIMHEGCEVDVAIKMFVSGRLDLMRHELHHIMSIPEHPRLIRAIGKCEEDTCVCIVLPLLTPLLNGADFVPLTEQERLQVCCDVTEAVVHLHSVRRLHRDIKPHNILLDSQKRAVLTDLGVTEEVLARGGFSPLFAPWEWSNAPASQFSGDIFCLGLTMACILADRIPANNTTSDRQALIESLRPRSLKKLVRQMMDADQARRPVAVDVLSRLRQLQGSAGAVAASSSPSDSDVAATSATAQHHPLSSSKLDKYPPRFSCSAEVAIERVDALNKIRAAFANENDNRLVLLYGPHGVGKTIAAAQYCKQRKQQQQSDRKIIAAQVQASTLRESLRDMFDIPIDSDKITFDDIRKTMDAIYDGLPADDKNTRICLLVDDLNCTDEETVKNFVFLSKSKLIDGIVATVPTESTPEYYEDCQRVQMTAFSVDDTIHLAGNVLGGADADTSAFLQQRGVDMDSAQALLDACDRKPFLVHRALEQFSDSLDPTSVKLADFTTKKLMPQTLESSARDRYEHTLKSISTLQIDAFRKHFKTPADAAVTPLELLLTACKKLQIQEFDMQFLRPVLHVDGGGSDNDVKLTEWIKWMKSNIGLVHNLADSTFKLHYLQSIGNPLFDGAMDWEHAAVLCQLEKNYDDALKLTTAWISSTPDDELRPRDKLTIAFCIVARTCALYRSNPTEAPTEKALSLWRRLEAAWKADKLPQGTRAETVARGAASLSAFCYYDAKYQIAADVCAVAMNFTETEELRAKLVNVRGISLVEMNKREEGVALKKEALEMRRRMHRGVDHPDLANSLNNVGMSLEEMGKHEEGVALTTEALEMRRRIHRGVDHPDVAQSLNNVGNSLERMGKREEGVALKTEALEMRRRIHRGVDHPDVAHSLNCVGVSLEQLGKSEEGAALIKEALEMRRRIHRGVDHPDVAHSLNCVGVSLDRSGKREEGAVLMKESLEMNRRIHRGVDHPGLAHSLYNVGVSLEQMGKRNEGIAFLQGALEMRRRLHRGVDHPDLASSLNSVGNSLERMGKREEGVTLQKEALEMRRRIHRGVDHFDVADALFNAGNSLERMGKGEEGVALQTEALEMRRRIHRGVDHPDLADSLNNVGASLEGMGKCEEGVALQKEALEMRRRIHRGVDHPDVAASLYNLGYSLERMGKGEEGVALIKEALAMYRRFGAASERVARIEAHVFVLEFKLKSGLITK